MNTRNESELQVVLELECFDCAQNADTDERMSYGEYDWNKESKLTEL